MLFRTTEVYRNPNCKLISKVEHYQLLETKRNSVHNEGVKRFMCFVQQSHGSLEQCKPGDLPGYCWFLIRAVGVRDAGAKKQNCFHYHCHRLS